MAVSVLEIFKIGVGPSSSHTLGPWEAATRFRNSIIYPNLTRKAGAVIVDLYGSLAHTGKGHGTDFAILMGLSGYHAASIEQSLLSNILSGYKGLNEIIIEGTHLQFSVDTHINLWKGQHLPFHSNGMVFKLLNTEGHLIQEETYYSVGGGFVQSKEEIRHASSVLDTSIISSAKSITDAHRASGKSLIEIILEHESQFHTYEEIKIQLLEIYGVMLSCAHDGCHTLGILPGGLFVERRAKLKHDKLLPGSSYTNAREWLKEIRSRPYNFRQTIDWVSCFAISVNEQNAAFGKVVTAPTNGAAGVIPAILLYIQTLLEVDTTEEDIVHFLLIAGLVGQMYKHGATISAAAGGCQAEIGVSSSMAAAGLVGTLGGTLEQVFMAAEIAMEHHLGLTCDPVNGLVQIPCIERNSIGAMKAITAAQLAMDSDPMKAKVSLDQVIKSMWETAQDMNEKYRETSLGGLAINVTLPEC